MLNKKKRISVLVIPDDGSRTLEFRISHATLWLSGGALVCFLLLAISGGISHIRVIQLNARMKTLHEEKIELEAETKKIVRLAHTLDRIKQTDRQVRTMLGTRVRSGEEMDPLLSNSRRTGLLKSPTDDPALLSAVHPLRSTRKTGNYSRFQPSIRPVQGWVTAEFGETSHKGIDIAAKRGSIIRATADGKVLFAGYEEDLGNLVLIDHGGGIYTRYGHNARLLVDEGEDVKKGQTIALLGSSGKKSTAPHLHYEVWEGGKPRDPRKYFLRP